MNKQKMIDNTLSYKDSLIKSLKNSREAALYLQVAFNEYQIDGDYKAFLLALRNVAIARGGIASLSDKTALNRQSLYRTLSRAGNPRLDTFGLIMKELGFKITISPAQQRH